MASRSASIFLIFFFVSVVAVPAMAAKVGGWQQLTDPNAPEVVMVAKFAVTKHNEEAKTSLVFKKVVKGESQVVAGTNYRLVISATDIGAATPKSYKAEVYYRPWQKFLQLKSFEEIKS